MDIITNEDDEGTDNEDMVEGSQKGKKSQPIWKEEDDQVLVKAWLEHSTNPAVGTNQSSVMFWGKIMELVNQHTGKGRTKFSCKVRWAKISREVGAYVGVVRTATSAPRSGESNEDIREAAMKIFFRDKKHHFNMYHIYPTLCEIPKF